MKRKRPPSSLPLFGEPETEQRKRKSRAGDGLPKGLSSDDYELDEDGYPREVVGEWARDKQARLEKYVHISAAARRKWLKSGASYIDLFCGPGRCRLKGTGDVIDGSPLTAWRKASARNSSFTHVVVSDAHPAISAAAAARLTTLGAPVNVMTGTAEENVDKAVAAVPSEGLHLAFLDPFDLVSLRFDIIERLAKLERIDILIHVSLLDLSRNLLRYVQAERSALDAFAPDWRQVVDIDSPQAHIRSQLFAHWRTLLKGIGMKTSEAAELVSGPNEQPLYWLAFAARHDLALKFWEQVRDLGGQQDYLRAI